MSRPAAPGLVSAPDRTTDGGAVAWLRTPAAIRERAERLLALGAEGKLDHFAVDLDRLAPTADYVVETTRAAYPDLAIPYHARWRHFAVGGIDRWAALAAKLGALDPDEIARVRFDLAVTSVLLDAGAGMAWRFDEGRHAEGGNVYARSEGLAVASIHMFEAGLFSADPKRSWRADAPALAALSTAALAQGFQVGPDNPLEGLEGRAALLRALGRALAADPVRFGASWPRVGGLYDFLKGQATGGRLPAAAILAALLQGLGPIWPGRVAIGGVNLGDVWRHGKLTAKDATDRLIPFHKLSQWLAYSLIEPLEDAGIRVHDIDALTGLPEYRNGGLMIDLGLLRPRDPSLLAQPQEPGAEPIVEWRGLTVALLDRLAVAVRERLGLDAVRFPLAKVLEGGTWAAGRRAARERRADGGPPIRIVSDGTVF